MNMQSTSSSGFFSATLLRTKSENGANVSNKQQEQAQTPGVSTPATIHNSCRWSRMTSWIGVGPSAPAGTRSNKDKAYERAAVTRAFNSTTLPLSNSNMPRTFAEAKLLKKWAVHFSPKENQPSPVFRPGQLWVVPFVPCAGTNQRCTVFCGTPGLRNSFPRQWAHESGINGELRAPEQGQTINDDSSLRSSTLLITGKSRSRTKTFVLTFPPNSRQIRAATFSNGNPRRPNTPATGHADRWWPRQPRKRPHRHERTVRGKV